MGDILLSGCVRQFFFVSLGMFLTLIAADGHWKPFSLLIGGKGLAILAASFCFPPRAAWLAGGGLLSLENLDLLFSSWPSMRGSCSIPKLSASQCWHLKYVPNSIDGLQGSSLHRGGTGTDPLAKLLRARSAEELKTGQSTQ